MHEQAAGGNDYEVCPSCDYIFQIAKPYKSALGFDDDDQIEDSPQNSTPTASVCRNKRSKNNHGGVNKGRDALGFEPLTKDSTWVSQSDHDVDFPLAPSAKTAALKALLLQGFNEAPTDKVGYSFCCLDQFECVN